MRKHLAELANAQVERKLLMRQACVEEKIEKYREAYARAMAEWNVKVSYLYVVVLMVMVVVVVMVGSC